MLGALLGLIIVSAGALAVAAWWAGGPYELFMRDPPKADYAALRRELVKARDLAQRSVGGARRSGDVAAGTALEQAIVSSRTRARRTGSAPIPPEIRDQLQPYFPGHVLDRVRWTYPNRYLDLDSLIAWYVAEGGAVTLQDTIVFAGRIGVESEYLWAHELTHMLQYEALGLSGFARLYAANPHVLEQQARDNANRIIRDIRAGQRDGRAGVAKGARMSSI